jgi:demethylmenaquinone methyltransferase/2-methoxy-6-polyprenyl-1,4-benzoquinol methylase
MTKMSHFNHFDFIAPVYDRFIKPIEPVNIRSLAGLPVSGNLLDVGGGTGRISYMLRNYVTEIFIADSSTGMLSQAKKKGRFISVCSKSEELPFEDDYFERVIMVDALHHVNDYRATINELWRVVKPGGRIVIEEPDIQTFPVKLMAIIEKVAFMRSHFISTNIIRDAFSYPNATTFIKREATTSWVVINKQIG